MRFGIDRVEKKGKNGKEKFAGDTRRVSRCYAGDEKTRPAS